MPDAIVRYNPTANYGVTEQMLDSVGSEDKAPLVEIAEYAPIANYGVTEQMLERVGLEYKAVLLQVQDEISAIKTDSERRSEIKERLMRAKEMLVSAYTDYSWLTKTALDAVAGGATVAGQENAGKLASALSGAPGQLNQQDIAEKRALYEMAETLQRELDGDTRRAGETLEKALRMIDKLVEMRLQASKL